MNWRAEAPQAFSLVACYYPYAITESVEPGPKLRPALVTSVYADDTGDFACGVAYGTTKLKITQRIDLDLIIQNHVHMEAVGLPKATRFDLDLIIVLPWTEEYFGCWRGYHCL